MSERRFRKVFTRKRLEDDRLEELLDIAEEIFVSEGFKGASTNTIARRANASKATIYSRFPTKEALFLAVIENRVSRITKAVTPALSAAAPPAVALYDFGSKLARAALTREHVAFVRMIGMEAERFPQLARRFFELGPGCGKTILAGYMRQCSERGSLRSDNPERMAEHFMSLVAGGDVHYFLLGLRPKPGPKRLEAHLRAALHTFFLAYGNNQNKH